MEESPPATSAPTEPIPPEAKGAPGGGKRWRVRVPTSVLVTLSVALLSIWVAPAFARQWDDRQKARELKVAFAEDLISEATAVISAATKPPLPGFQPAADYDVVLNRWTKRSAVLQAKLRAYFPDDLARDWSDFRLFMEHGLIAFASALPEAQKRHADDEGEKLAEMYEPVLVSPYGEWDVDSRDQNLAVFFSIIINRSFREGLSEKERQQGLRNKSAALADAVTNEPPGGAAAVFQDMQIWADEELAEFTDRLLTAHLTGYSTTRGDLLRDLLP
jgi:hypothetical protein